MDVKIIHKRTMEPYGRPRMELPKGAKILKVSVQYGFPTVWYEFVPMEPQIMETREIHSVVTGRIIPENWKHIDTVLLKDGNLVLHYYEVPIDPSQ